MALNRPRVKAGAKTSVVLGHDKGPHITTYHTTFELNMPRGSVGVQPRFQLPPSEIFHRTEPKCPLTVHQASFGDTPSYITNRVYQGRKKEFKAIMGIHLLKSVPMGQTSIDRYVVDTSQMRNDYQDRQSAMHNWTMIQHPQLPKLPPLGKTPSQGQGHRRWYGHKTEAAHQFQWPSRDCHAINQVKFKRN